MQFKAKKQRRPIGHLHQISVGDLGHYVQDLEAKGFFCLKSFQKNADKKKGVGGRFF
jgi:hypothetical protein